MCEHGHLIVGGVGDFILHDIPTVTPRFEISSRFLLVAIVLIFLSQRVSKVILKITLEVPYQPCSLVPVSTLDLSLYVLADRLSSFWILCICSCKVGNN